MGLAIEKLLQPVAPKGTYVHFGEKAKTETFWDRTRSSIDSWELQGKMLIVHGHDEKGYAWNFGAKWIHIIGMSGPWVAYFPASVCAVWSEPVDGYDDSGDPLPPKLMVQWPMWLKDVRCYADKPKKPELNSVAEIRTTKEGKVPELKARVVKIGEPEQTYSKGTLFRRITIENPLTLEQVELVAWENDAHKFDDAEPGDDVRIVNGYAKEYVTKQDIKLGKSGKVTVSAGKFGTLEVIQAPMTPEREVRYMKKHWTHRPEEKCDCGKTGGMYMTYKSVSLGLCSDSWEEHKCIFCGKGWSVSNNP